MRFYNNGVKILTLNKFKQLFRAYIRAFGAIRNKVIDLFQIR
jgi:hypothetical protein